MKSMQKKRDKLIDDQMYLGRDMSRQDEEFSNSMALVILVYIGTIGFFLGGLYVCFTKFLQGVAG